MNYEVRVELEAWEDVDAALDWLGQASPAFARRWYDGLLEALRTLGTNPERCPRAPEDEFFAAEIRQLTYGRRKTAYRVLFTIHGRRVHVLHIRHAARLHLRPEEN